VGGFRPLQEGKERGVLFLLIRFCTKRGESARERDRERQRQSNMDSVLETLRTHHRRDLIKLVRMHLSFLIEKSPEEWEKIVSYVDKEQEELVRTHTNN